MEKIKPNWKGFLQLIRTRCESPGCRNEVWANWMNSHGKILPLCRDHFELVSKVHESEEIEPGLVRIARSEKIPE